MFDRPTRRRYKAAMAKQPPRHWGDWIAERARAVGFRRQQDFAAAIGCTPERLSRWAQMSKPPGRMLKGFDAAMAKALQVTREMLFSEFAHTDPYEAPQFNEISVSLPGVYLPWTEPGWVGLPRIEQLKSLLRVLSDEDAERLVATALSVAMASVRKQREDFLAEMGKAFTPLKKPRKQSQRPAKSQEK